MRIKWAIIVFLLFIMFYLLYTCKGKHGDDDNKGKKDSIRVEGIEKDTMTYKKDQVIVVFKQTPTPAQIDTIKQAYLREGLTDSIHISKCGDCDGLVQLWEAPGIQTFISTQGVKGGSSGSSRGAGEDSLAKYSLNYINSVPVDVTISRGNIDTPQKDTNINGTGKDTIVVAVLDTGIDTLFVGGSHLWRNSSEPGNGNADDCYKNDQIGWNFVSGNTNVRDDNNGIHGTLVSQYIINEFNNTSRNFLQVMPLKTHDQNGAADLFNTICAIHYAIDKGANIINASWGFYNYHSDPLPYLDSLINDILPRHGILFFAAAGNKIHANDSLANEFYKLSHAGADIPDTNMLRDLAVNSFYPACLSHENNNVITVTTTDEIKVSPTQNFSDLYADMAVTADSFEVGHMYFKQPFKLIPFKPDYISGSSFATPIAVGKIAANFDKHLFIPNLKKSDFFNNTAAAGIIFTSAALRNAGLIRKGKFSKHVP